MTLAFQGAFLGGATASWGLGLTVALIGLALAIRPPERSLGRWLNLLLLALLAWGALPLLPMKWLAVAEPAWRANFRDYASDLPVTISPQPALTAEAWLLFIAGVSAFYWFATLRPRHDRTGNIVRFAASAAAAFAATCLLFRLAHFQPSFWHNDWRFGPFPSRNHTGNLLALGAILCGGCAVADWEKRRMRGWWFAAGAAVCCIGLVENLSRGAVLSAGVAAMIFGGWLAWRRQSGPVLGVLIAGVVVATVGLCFFAGRFSERLWPSPFSHPEELFGFRGQIYRDVCHMIAREPLAGVGLANFEPVFEFYRAASLAEVRVIHPESDWLWAASELGWPGALMLLSALVMLGYSARQLLRSARVESAHVAAAALCAFLLHGLFDVPAHLFGTVLPALLLTGAVTPPHGLAAFSRGAKFTFRLLGILLLCAGGWIALGHGSSRAAAIALVDARLANEVAAPARALEAAERGLKVAPLWWELRFQRAVAQLGLDDFEGAQASFKCARLLQPRRADLREAEADLWWPHSPALAQAAWREALALDRSPFNKVLLHLVAAARQKPALAEFVREQVLQAPELFLAYRVTAEKAQVAAMIEAWHARDPDFARIPPAQLPQLLADWARHEPARVAALIREHPAWEDAGWPILAHDLAAQKQFEAACALARQHLRKPVYPLPAPGTREQLRLRLIRTPGDFPAALALSEAEESAGDPAMARFVLRRALQEKDAPGYLSWREAELAALAGEHELAWMALRRYGHF